MICHKLFKNSDTNGKKVISLCIFKQQYIKYKMYLKGVKHCGSINCISVIIFRYFFWYCIYFKYVITSDMAHDIRLSSYHHINRRKSKTIGLFHHTQNSIFRNIPRLFSNQLCRRHYINIRPRRNNC